MHIKDFGCVYEAMGVGVCVQRGGDMHEVIGTWGVCMK